MVKKSKNVLKVKQKLEYLLQEVQHPAAPARSRVPRQAVIKNKLQREFWNQQRSQDCAPQMKILKINCHLLPAVGQATEVRRLRDT